MANCQNGKDLKLYGKYYITYTVTMRTEFQQLMQDISTGVVNDEPGEADIARIQAHINECDELGRTMLMVAELYGRPKLSIHLMDLGCDPWTKDKKGRDWYYYRDHLHGSEQRKLELDQTEREEDLRRLSNEFSISIHSPDAKKIRL